MKAIKGFNFVIESTFIVKKKKYNLPTIYSTDIIYTYDIFKYELCYIAQFFSQLETQDGCTPASKVINPAPIGHWH